MPARLDGFDRLAVVHKISCVLPSMSGWTGFYSLRELQYVHVDNMHYMSLLCVTIPQLVVCSLESFAPLPTLSR